VLTERAGNDGTHFQIRGEPETVSRLRSRLGRPASESSG
jgi:hypothetical protein